MTDMLPFNMSFPAESVVFVVDEYSQYKKAMIDDYCYTHSPIVISEIGQLSGKQAPPANKNLLLDCVLKWDDTRQYNDVAEVLRFHTTGLLMTMNKPAAFDPLIRAKVDYLVLFRGRNLRHLRRIYRQYLSSVLDDPAELTGLFKSLGWGDGLVLDLSAMQASGRFAGNYYKYFTGHAEPVTPDNTYANLDVALGDWIASGITNPSDSQSTPELPSEPTPEYIIEDWEMITPVDYTISRPAQPSSSIPEIRITEEPTSEPAPTPTSESTSASEPTLAPDNNIIPQEQHVDQQTDKLPEKEDTQEETQEDTQKEPNKQSTINQQQQQQQQQGWAAYLYSKAWSLFA